jgi:hypothetical protein
LAGWLLLSVLLIAVLFIGGRWFMEERIREQVGEHLLLTLDESHFSNDQGRVNDRSALEKLGRQINIALADLVDTRWYAARRDCSVSLLRIDDVVIDDSAAAGSTTLALPRNQIDREVDLAVSCSPGWTGAAVVTGLLGACFLALYWLLPSPLSGTHRGWIEYLQEHGYGEAEAFDIVSGYDAGALVMNAAQLEWIERLHDSEARNFAGLLEVVSDPRVAQLSEEEAEWASLALCRDPEDLPGALALAAAPDSMVIDLNRMTLTVRGRDVVISRTPLFYLTWYAMNRQQGEGWITNPASNRPDADAAGALVKLMSRYDGHARAINDLQQAGLKARTLDQNRSKIKEDLVAALGESLASRYLFETSKHPDGVRMRYRLRLEASKIRVITR